LFNEKGNIFRNLLESLKNIIEIYKRILWIGAAHFSLMEYSRREYSREYSEFQTKFKKQVEKQVEELTKFENQVKELLKRLNELKTKTTHLSLNGNGKKNSHNGLTENDNK
jgi:pyruvate/2-oxoacid:ferredoxin oxidoreductase beta subunit